MQILATIIINLTLTLTLTYILGLNLNKKCNTQYKAMQFFKPNS